MKFIDLGLPSGTLWAEKDLVLNGKDRFMWAQVDLVDKNSPYLEEIKAEVDSESESITMVKKYNSYPCYGVVDNKSYLELTDDIAYRLGNNEWRIPSVFEFIELLDVDLCDMITDRENRGLWIKSKKNGNKVFFGLGHYWSNTLYEKNPTNAYIFCITCPNMYLVNLHREEPYLFYAQINAIYRSNDLKIRPVLIKN